MSLNESYRHAPSLQSNHFWQHKPVIIIYKLQKHETNKVAAVMIRKRGFIPAAR